MALYRKGDHVAVFTPDNPVEKHFHDHDETWVILGGKANALMIDREGNREEFLLEEGDCWMIEIGIEHGADPITPEFTLIWIDGTCPPGGVHSMHQDMEKEGYIPSFELTKTPTDRYEKP